MTTLRDRLADLAEDVPVSPAAPDLWRLGRRHGRRRAAATAAASLAVALVAAVGAAGLAGRSVHRVEPVTPPGAETVLPDRFFEPSARLPVAVGGTGPLVAVIPAEHSSWHLSGDPGLVGVSAVDQDYAFLDLPGWIGDVGMDDSWSLSTNGRWVAYWYGDRESVGAESPADGIAVLDTTTGEVRRHELPSKLGVQAYEVAWAGDTLWFTEWAYRSLDEDSASGRLVAAYTWDLDDDAPREVDDPHKRLIEPVGPAPEDGFLTLARGDRYYAIHDEADLTRARLGRFAAPGESGPEAAALSPDGRTFAMSAPDDRGSKARVLTGTVAGDDSHIEYLDADLGSYAYLLGWLDDDSLAVMVYRADSRQLVSVDVGTRQSQVLSTFEQPVNDRTQLASDLLRSPVVPAKEPPDPADPLKVAPLVGLGVLALLWAGRTFRRRRARR